MRGKGLRQNSGFTLLELLVMITIIGFIASAAMVALNVTRIRSRDAMRSANISEIRKALSIYLNDYGSYPNSAGECFYATSTTGTVLHSANLLAIVPSDPLWPSTVPSSIITGHAAAGASDFCYYYWANNNSFYLSYYLESDSKAGSAGVHVISQ